MQLLPIEPYTKDALAHAAIGIVPIGGDFHDVYMAITRLTEYCSVAYNDGNIYGVFWPQYEGFSQTNTFKFHGIITPVGLQCKNAQQQMIKDYCSFIFGRGYRKVVTEVPDFNKLLAHVLRRVGFTQEGVFRQEWETSNGTFADIIRFSLFQEDLIDG